MKRTEESSVIICGIVRDAEKGLRRNIPVIRDLCKKFSNYKVVVFENDSHDKTKQLLSEWMVAEYGRVFVYMSDSDGAPTIPSFNDSTVNPFFGHKRIDRMAELRNQYMDLLWSKGWDADYLMVVDLDVAGIDIDGVSSSFDTPFEWDAVTAFGYSRDPLLRLRYHDTYALALEGDVLPQTEEKIKQLRNQLSSLGNESIWMRVYSAFGGLAIYKMDAVRGLRYKVVENDDPRVEVRCEHYSLYSQMQELGYDKVFINPKMRVKYQEINAKTIIKYLKNRRASRLRPSSTCSK